jgi:WD40 repeat protein
MFSFAARIAIAVALAMMMIALTACGDDEEDVVAADPTPTVEEVVPFAPEQVFKATIAEDSPVHSAAYHPDGEMVAAGAYLEVLLLNPDDGSILDMIDADHSVYDLDVSPDGSLIALGQGVYGVKLSNVDDGAEHLSLHGGYDNVVAFSPDGETIATANRDGVLWIWDVETGMELSEFAPAEPESATSVVFSPNGEAAALGNWGGHVFLWNVENGELVGEFENPGAFGFADGIAFSVDGGNLAVAGAQLEFDDVVRVWNVDDGSVEGTIPFENQTRAVAYSPDGAQLAGAGGTTIMIVDPDSLEVIHEITLEYEADVASWITDLAYSPDGRMLFVSRWDGTVEMWQVQE